MDDDYEFWLAEQETFRRIAAMSRKSAFHVWVCPACQVLQRAPMNIFNPPTCNCGEPMPSPVEDYSHARVKPCQVRKTYVPPRIPTAEQCVITERTNEVARRLVESALS